MRNGRGLWLGVLAASALAGSGQIMAHQQGEIFLRAGAALVEPDESSSVLALDGTALANTEANVGTDTQLGLTAVYMLSNNLGLELLASTPFEHEIKSNGLAAYGVDVNKVGTAKHLPPTLSLQYYPMDGSAAFQPYVGVGINYTAFFSEDTSAEIDGALGSSKLSLDNSVGLAVQAGFDYQINEKWLVNAAVWNIAIDTEATIKSPAGTVTVDVDIDPWVYMVGVGYKF